MSRINVVTDPPMPELTLDEIGAVLANSHIKAGQYGRITLSPTGRVMSGEDFQHYAQLYSQRVLPKPEPKVKTVDRGVRDSYENLYWDYVNFSGTGNPYSDHLEAQKRLEAMREVVTIDTEHIVDKPKKKLKKSTATPSVEFRHVFIAAFILFMIARLVLHF